MLAFGSDSSNTGSVQPKAPVALVPPRLSPAPVAAAAVMRTAPDSNGLSSSPHSLKSHDSESLSVPAAVCPGYVSDENAAAAVVDFPPADLPAGTNEFRIVVTHVDDDGHIYGHALREGMW